MLTEGDFPLISNSGEVVNSGVASSEGLNFSFTKTFGNSGGKIYYCKDTANTCNPGTTIKSGTLVQHMHLHQVFII